MTASNLPEPGLFVDRDRRKTGPYSLTRPVTGTYRRAAAEIGNRVLDHFETRNCPVQQLRFTWTGLHEDGRTILDCRLVFTNGLAVSGRVLDLPVTAGSAPRARDLGRATRQLLQSLSAELKEQLKDQLEIIGQAMTATSLTVTLKATA